MDAAEAGSRVAALPVYDGGRPWGEIVWGLVGGVTEVGFGRDEGGNELILCVGWNGRGVFDRAGRRVARDHDPLTAASTWHDPQELTAEGIGPLAGSRVTTCGLWGGALPLTTADGWSVRRLMVSWPEEQVVLQPPGADVLWAGHDEGCARLPEGAGSEVLAAGFSPSGQILIAATSADLLILSRW